MKRRIKKSQFENIDSLRFMAFLAIFFNLAFITDDVNLASTSFYRDLVKFSDNLKSAGISLIFILTAFLNTHSLFEERFVYKTINLPRLFIRRLLTIVPVYILIFLLGYFILPAIQFGNENWEVSQSPPLSFLTFTHNFWVKGQSNLLAWVIDHLWLVAAQMQIVFILPLLLRYFRRLELVVLAMCLIGFAVFEWLGYKQLNTQYHTMHYASDVALGIGLGYMVFFKYAPYNYFKTFTRRSISGMYLLLVMWAFFHQKLLHTSFLPEAVNAIILKVLTGFLIAYVIFEQHFSSRSIFKLSKFKILDYFGSFSYGLYAYTPVGILLSVIIVKYLSSGESSAGLLLLTQVSMALIITVVLAIFSYEFWEKKFHRLRKNYLPVKDYTPVSLEDDSKKFG